MEDDKMTIASHVKLRSEEEEKALFSWIFGVQEVSSRKTPVFGLNGGMFHRWLRLYMKLYIVPHILMPFLCI